MLYYIYARRSRLQKVIITTGIYNALMSWHLFNVSGERRKGTHTEKHERENTSFHSDRQGEIRSRRCTRRCE